MRKLIILWLCLAAFALAQPQILIEDMLLREENYALYPDRDGNYDPNREPTLLTSSMLKNKSKTTASKLKMRVTWYDADLKALRQETEALPEIKAGKEFLYWTPPFFNLRRQKIIVQLEVLDGDRVIATASK